MGDYYRLGRIRLFLTGQILPSRAWTKMGYLYQIDMENTVTPLFRGRRIQNFTHLAIPRHWRRFYRGGPNERWGVLKKPRNARKLTQTTRYTTHTPCRGTLLQCLFFFGMISLP